MTGVQTCALPISVLDVSGMEPGRHVGQLQLTLDSEFIVGDTSVSFTISSDSNDDETNTGTDDVQTDIDSDTGADTGSDTDVDQDDESSVDDSRTRIDDLANREEE